MKQFLKNGILFFILFFVIEKGVYYILDKSSEREYDKRLEYVIKGEMNKDLIVLGSSLGGGNIIAGQIEKETGYSAFNLSYQGADIMFKEFILKTLLKFNKPPKKIILAVDSPYEFIDKSTLNFRLDRLYPLSKYNYINAELIRQEENSIMSKLFYLARVRTSNFKTELINPPSLNPFESCGSRPVIKNTQKDFVFSEAFSKYTITDEMPEKLKAFKEIQTLCKAYNIQLIFAFSPNYYNFNSKFKNRFEELMLSENKIIVYDSLNPVYRKKDNFYDALHLKKESAKVFTSEISEFINEN